MLASYAVFFGIVLWPWIQVATYGAPAGHNSNVEDRWLVPWIIGWVGHVLTVAPWRLFDVPINHPVPAQLAAIEHFLSSSIAALPVLGATGNAVLATNVVAIASYPLAALCMNRLLVALGCSALAAWVAGVAFALGPERVPGNVMSLKYPNLYLPLVALCLTRLREQPDVGRAAWLALALTLALLSSYYLAVLVLFAAGIWGLCELARRSPDRARYLGWAIAAAIAALAVLAVISIPYFARPEAILSGEGDRISPIRMMLNRYLLGMRVWGLGNLQVYIAAAALLLVAAARPVGLLARRGALIAAIALALMLGPQQVLFGREVTLPFALLAESPASFFRYPFRFSVLWGFGAALLVAATLEAMRRRLPGALGSSVIAAVAALTLEGQLRRAAGTGVEEYVSIRQPVYAAVRDVAAADGTGPLLELPHDPGFRVGEAPRVEIQSMLGWTIHRQPLILGYVDFPPLQRRWINGAISRLPAGNAIDDLKSMTGLKWLLLQPRAVWREPEQRDRLMRHGGMTMMLSQDGWDLLRIDRPVRHPEWLAHVAAGKQPD
ncbi:MAG: hypothetical protein FJX57_22890, partial [Alphaproteobacteria bacterium]|nr:hypothetical protein [Alphaproteobacteria bacterium]